MVDAELPRLPGVRQPQARRRRASTTSAPSSSSPASRSPRPRRARRVEIRTGDSADGQLDSYATAGSGTVEGTTEFTFDEPATARYVLVWVTGLVEGGEGFSADLAEVSILSAG